MDVKARMGELLDEFALVTCQTEAPSRPGLEIAGATVGDAIAWTDHYAEADWANVLVPARRLVGVIVQMQCHKRWGIGVLVRLTAVPTGDTLQRGDVVFRWGDRILWNGHPEKIVLGVEASP